MIICNLGKLYVFLHHYIDPFIVFWSHMLNTYGRKKDLRKCKTLTVILYKLKLFYVWTGFCSLAVVKMEIADFWNRIDDCLLYIIYRRNIRVGTHSNGTEMELETTTNQ